MPVIRKRFQRVVILKYYVPSYANILMGNFEAKHIYPYIKDKSLLYLSYNDDTFKMWKATNAELMTFIKELNE